MSATTHILVEIVVTESDGQSRASGEQVHDNTVDAGAYLDASLAYMCEVADDAGRIKSYRILKSTGGKL